MNKHLKPVFEILLLKLNDAQIDYWVYGGVSIAAFKGEFIRDNKDVDIFVKETDFQKTSLILDGLCNQNNFEIIYHRPKESSEKPKLDIKIDGKERMSVVPVYQKNNIAIFKYRDSNEEYSNKILEKIERNISGYRFFTPQDKFIKDMFINHIKSRPDKMNRNNFRKDAKAVLTPEEYLKYTG